MADIRVSNRRTPEGGPTVVETGPVFSVLNALLRFGVPVRHDCGGKALCGTCRFRVVRGASALSPRYARESERLAAIAEAGELPADGEYRLACQAHTAGNIEIELVL